jgi:hypothetical protein
MASSDVFADEALTLIVEAGGSWYFGLLDDVPPDDLSTFSLITDIPAVTLARNSATWDVAGRQANPAAPITLDTSSLTGDVVALGWCLFDDSGRTVPHWAGRITGTGIKIVPDAPTIVPTTTVNIRFPATVAATL